MDKSRLLYRNAFLKWGRSLQRAIAIEEMAELIKALVKYERNADKDTMQNLIEEVADVEIMIEQLREMFGIDEEVDEIKEQKLERLEKRLG